MKPAPPSPAVRSRLAAWLRAIGCTVVLGLSCAVAGVHADSYDDRRLRAGARLFRTMLAADTGLATRVDGDGVLQVLVYGPVDGGASDAASSLIAPPGAGKSDVRGLKLAVRESASLPAAGDRIAAVFLAAKPSDADLDRLIAWSIERKVIVYSPFEGHVERGVAGGLAIEAKVQPHVNLSTLEAAGIELKPFFLKVAKVQR